MSNNSFDDAVLSRFDSAPNDNNALSINSLTASDFQDYNTAKRYDPISGKPTMADWGVSEKVPGIDFNPLETIAFKPEDFGGILIKPYNGFEPGITTLPGFDIGGDRPSKYPLPEDVSAPSGESALSALNQRIINTAVGKVQESMTPAEKEALNKDAAKYAEEMRQYEKEERAAMMQHYFRGPNDWPKPPQKPQSLVKYEEAIDREIERQVRRASV